MKLDTWETFDSSIHTFYDYREAACYVMRVLDVNNKCVVGSIGTYNYYIKQNWLKQFGLILQISKVRQPKVPVKKEPDRQTYEDVTIKLWYKDELISMNKERRTVYHNSKGKYIKRRGQGRTYLDENNLIEEETTYRR